MNSTSSNQKQAAELSKLDPRLRSLFETLLRLPHYCQVTLCEQIIQRAKTQYGLQQEAKKGVKTSGADRMKLLLTLQKRYKRFIDQPLMKRALKALMILDKDGQDALLDELEEAVVLICMYSKACQDADTRLDSKQVDFILHNALWEPYQDAQVLVQGIVDKLNQKPTSIGMPQRSTNHERVLHSTRRKAT